MNSDYSRSTRWLGQGMRLHSCRAVAMKFEVVRLGLTCACMNYSACDVCLLGGSGGMPPTKMLNFRPSEVVSDVIVE